MGKIIMLELTRNSTVPVRHHHRCALLRVPINLQTYAQIAGKGCSRGFVWVGGSINREEEEKTGFFVISRDTIVFR